MTAAPNLPQYQEPPEGPREVERRPERERWKMIAAWAAGITLLLILVIMVGIYELLHNESLHRFVLKKAEEQATAALGTQLQVRDFVLHFRGISPSLDLYNFVMNGASPYPKPPLLTIDHIHLGIRIVSVLSKTWYLDDVTINHPVVRIFVDRRGTNNLPQTNSLKEQSNVSVFDLGVRHALLDNGEVYYNNKKSAMNAELRDLAFRSAFDASQKRYSGSLSYKDGHLFLEKFNPIPHDLNAEFDANPQTFTVKNATLHSGNSQFVLHAVVSDYSNPQVRATYKAAIDSGQLRKTLKNASLPIGMLRVDGSLQYQTKTDTPMLALVVLNGSLASRALQVITPTMRIELHNVSALYSVRQGNLDLRDIRAALLGGELTGNMTMRNLTGKSQSRLVAELRGISVAALKSLITAESASVRQVALNGRIDASADAAWGPIFDNMTANANVALSASMASTNGRAAPAPIDGMIHAKFVNTTKAITLANSYVRLPQTSLNLNGTVSNHSTLQVQFQSNDLHELENIANGFRASGSQALGLYGTATFKGTVSGSMATPHLDGQLTTANLRLRDTQWRVLRAKIDASPSGASLTNGELEPADRGRITFNFSTGLDNWSFSETSPIKVGLTADNLNAGELARAGGVTTPIQGTLSANVAVHGTELNPIGQGTLSLTHAQVSSETISSLNATFNGTGKVIRAKLSAHIPAGSANGNAVYYPKTEAYDAQLQVPGLQLGQLQTLKQHRMNLSGVLRFVASGRGTVKDPQLTVAMQIPTLVIDHRPVNGFALNASVANHVGSFTLDSQAFNTSIRSRGSVNLSGDYNADVTVDTQTIPLDAIIGAYVPSQAGKISGETELHARLQGPLKDQNRVEAHAQIPKLNMSYDNRIQIGAAGPIRIDYANGVLQLQPAQIHGTGTDLQIQATVPVADPNAPVSVLALGAVDLKLVELFDPDVTTSGQLKLDVNSYGQRANPDVKGQIQLVNAGFTSEDVPLGLQRGNGVFTLSRDRLNVTSFSGTVGGGEVTATGGIAYRPKLNFDLSLQGHGIRLPYPEGVRTGVGMNLALTGNLDSARLSGQVRINQLSFTRDFDLMSFVSQFSSDTVPPPSQGFANNLNLDITVAATNGINLVSRTMSLDGSANLEVKGTAADPVILGRVNLSDGDVIFQGNRYVLQSGTIDFVNPYQTQPNINVAVTTTIQEYNIMMRFDGPPDRLHTTYTSVPSLPPADIINLVAFGKTTEAAAANPTPSGSLGAQSLVASQVSSQVTSRFERAAGISQLTIDPELGNNLQNPGATIAIQQRVTGNLFVTFATDVTATQNATIKMEYRVTPRVSFSATGNQNGGFGFVTKIRKSW